MSVKVHEAFSLDSFQDRLLWFDDFHGDQLQDEWDLTAVGAGSATVVDSQTGGIVRLLTGALVNNTAQIDWNNIRSLLVTKRTSFETKVKLNNVANAVVYLTMGSLGALDSCSFYFNTGLAHANWYIRNESGGATEFDSGIVLDTDYHIFRIECHTHGGNHIHYYIDDVQCANSPITTNVTALHMQPYFNIRTRAAAALSFDIDYVYLRQER